MQCGHPVATFTWDWIWEAFNTSIKKVIHALLQTAQVYMYLSNPIKYIFHLKQVSYMRSQSTTLVQAVLGTELGVSDIEVWYHQLSVLTAAAILNRNSKTGFFRPVNYQPPFQWDLHNYHALCDQGNNQWCNRFSSSANPLHYRKSELSSASGELLNVTFNFIVIKTS